MFNNNKKRKPNKIQKIIKTASFISFSLLLLRLGYLGKIEPELMVLFFVFLLIVNALGKRFLYALLGIVSFVLFVKMNTNGSQEEWSVTALVCALSLVLLIIYKMIKTLSSK